MAGSKTEPNGAALPGGSLLDGAALPGGSLREESRESIGDLLGLVTHDLRNPLAALSSNVGFLQMLASEMKAEAKEAIDDLQISVEALGRIADGLELLGHELAGRATEPIGTQLVGSVVRSVKKSALRSAKSHEIRLTFATEDQEGVGFRAADPSFTRALSGLIHNALTVAPPKSEVVVLVRVQGPSVVFRVEDGGPALSAEMLASLGTAEAQNRLKSSRGARYSRGLGLFTVHHWATRSGAQLRVGEAATGSALELVTSGV